VSGRVPSALAFDAGPGFTFDTRTFNARCTRQQATLNECPPGSAMGGGTLVIGVTLPEGSRDAVFPLRAYMAQGNRLFMIAYVTGWRTVPGTILSAGGLTLSFDPLPKPPPFPNVSYSFKRITLDIGASRIIRKVVRTKVKSRRKRGSRRRTRRRVTRTRVDLVRAPAQCAGSWPASVRLTFPDGSTVPLPAPMACTP
jgi:hypothetical protein